MECESCRRVGSRDDATGYHDGGLCPACEERQDAQYLSTAQAARYLGTTPAGWHRTAVSHGVPSVRYGTAKNARRLYRRADIDRWLESCRQRVEAGVR